MTTEKREQQSEVATAQVGNHVILRCPHCDQRYEAEISNNPLLKHGLTITPIPLLPDVETEVEQ